MFRGRRALCLVLSTALILGLTACVDPAMQPSAILSGAPAASSVYVVQATVRSNASNTNDRDLRQGSTWTALGTIDQGTVYKPLDTVLTVEHFDVYEAYIVVRDKNWVGFWLPVEKAFVPMSKLIPIDLQAKE
jgi:hypothetical protein